MHACSTCIKNDVLGFQAWAKVSSCTCSPENSPAKGTSTRRFLASANQVTSPVASMQVARPSFPKQSILTNSPHVLQHSQAVIYGYHYHSLMMPPKKFQPALTNDELLSQFDDLGIEEPTAPPKSSKASKAPSTQASQEQDPLAELDDLVKQRPISRPSTPRLQSSTAPNKRNSTSTPPPGRGSEEKGAGTRKSGDSAKSFHNALTPGSMNVSVEDSAEPEEQPAQSTGGGWWGGIFATASAAVKTAEAAYKEIQKNEEAQKWAEQVKGNVGALRGLGMASPKRSQPTHLIV
jgi:hypothetical protein